MPAAKVLLAPLSLTVNERAWILRKPLNVSLDTHIDDPAR